MPAEFTADRVFVVPVTTNGDRLRLFTDSGGGLFLKQATVEHFHLQTEAVTDPEAKKEFGDDARSVRLPAFAPGKGIPSPLVHDGQLLVMPAKVAQNMLRGMSAFDGMLGTAWFAGRVWTWDYPGKHLRLEGATWQPSPDSRRVALGFKKSADGGREANFPRIEVKVDGQGLSLLLDTGASTLLTPQAMGELKDGKPAERATSMIADSTFQAWHNAHPDWRVIEKAQADTNSAMIEVPTVEIAGYRVGPVWFTHRADKNFHEYMSSMMDARVDGAIGGNALGHFVMTVDYPNAVAYFRCVEGCAQP